MKGATQIPIAVCTFLINDVIISMAMPEVWLPTTPAMQLGLLGGGISCVALGAVVADVDRADSTIAEYFPPVRGLYEVIITTALGRQRWGHTVWFNAIVGVLALMLTAHLGLWQYGIAFVGGQVSHLLLDMWNGKVQLWAPFSKRGFSWLSESRWMPEGFSEEYLLMRSASALMLFLIMLRLYLFWVGWGGDISFYWLT